MKRSCNRCGATPAANTWHVPKRLGGGAVAWEAYALCDPCYRHVAGVAAGRHESSREMVRAIEVACQPAGEGGE